MSKQNWNKVTLEQAEHLLRGGASWFEIAPGFIGVVWPTVRFYSVNSDGEPEHWEASEDFQYKHSDPKLREALRSKVYDSLARAKRSLRDLQEEQAEVSKLESAYRALGGDPSTVPAAHDHWDE